MYSIARWNIHVWPVVGVHTVAGMALRNGGPVLPVLRCWVFRRAQLPGDFVGEVIIIIFQDTAALAGGVTVNYLANFSGQHLIMNLYPYYHMASLTIGWELIT